MGVFVINGEPLTGEVHEKVRTFLEKENISFSEYQYLDEAYVDKHIREVLHDQNPSLIQNETFIERVSETVLEEDPFQYVRDEIEEAIEKDELVVVVDENFKISYQV